MTVQETASRGLIDLTHLPLSQLWKLEQDDALSHALRRATEAAEGKSPDEAVCAFNSAI